MRAHEYSSILIKKPRCFLLHSFISLLFEPSSSWPLERFELLFNYSLHRLPIAKCRLVYIFLDVVDLYGKYIMYRTFRIWYSPQGKKFRRKKKTTALLWIEILVVLCCFKGRSVYNGWWVDLLYSPHNWVVCDHPKKTKQPGFHFLTLLNSLDLVI